MVREALRVLWKEGCPPNIAKLQNKHDDSLEPYSSTPVGRTSPSKAVDVVHHTHQVQLIFVQTPFQMFGAVDALTTRENLLPTDEEIKGIADLL